MPRKGTETKRLFQGGVTKGESIYAPQGDGNALITAAVAIFFIRINLCPARGRKLIDCSDNKHSMAESIYAPQGDGNHS